MSLSRESKQKFRQMLIDMRIELLGQLKSRDQVNGNREAAGDEADLASTDMAAEYAWMLRHRLGQRLLLVDDALDAIENDEYGICEECEKTINEKRLLLMPFTRLCAPCQSEVERKAKLRGQIAA